MAYANAKEIQAERIKDYASTVKNILGGERDGDGYNTAAEAQAIHDSHIRRHDELREEANPKKRG